MGVSTCNMCNQFTTSCSCTSTCNPCRVTLKHLLVNGQNSNQETIEFLGSTIGQNIIQDGCGYKLQLRIPGVSYDSTTQILSVEDGDGNIDNIDLGVDIYVNNGSFNGTSLILNDTDAGTPDINVDLSGLRATITTNANGSVTINNGAGSSATLGWVSTQTYTITNVTWDRAYNADSTDVDELADVVWTLIDDLRSAGIIL